VVLLVVLVVSLWQEDNTQARPPPPPEIETHRDPWPSVVDSQAFRPIGDASAMLQMHSWYYCYPPVVFHQHYCCHLNHRWIEAASTGR